MDMKKKICERNVSDSVLYLRRASIIDGVVFAAGRYR